MLFMRILRLFIISVFSLLYLIGVSGTSLAKQPPANGKYVEYRADGKTIATITWRKENRVVRRKRYHDNGKLYRDIVYHDGKRIIERVYYSNGRLKSMWTAKTQEIKMYDKYGKFRKEIYSPRGIKKITK